jgi:thiol-disulfide isomerase/thioredoxin
MTTRKSLAARGSTVLLLCAVAALGAGPDDSKAGARKGEAVLQRMADYYKKAKSFAVDVDRDQKLGPMAMKTTVSVVFERPNKVAIRSKGPMPGVDIVSDGKTLTMSVGALKRYTQSKAPASLSDVGGDPLTQQVLMGTLQGTMIMELAAADPYKALMDGVKTCELVGDEDVDGAKAQHVKCTQDEFDWEVWVAAQGDPVIRKVTVDMSKALAKMPQAAQLKGQKLEMVQTFKGWKIDAPADEKAFAFEPPADSKKVGSLMEGLGGGGGGGDGGGAQEEPRSPLVGKPATNISLDLVDKGKFELKDHRDKDVVMIDFWATWCGPCVMELPILTEVAEGYKDKGVAFYAINLRESPAQIKKFQEDKKLKFTVALDKDGATANAYNVEGIPTLVLVDKKGVVQSVHVGYNPGIKKTLAQELDALLAGKDLAKEAGGKLKVKASD